MELKLSVGIKTNGEWTQGPTHRDHGILLLFIYFTKIPLIAFVIFLVHN